MLSHFRDKTAYEATYDVLNVQLPRLETLIDDFELHIDNIDVFCEKGVFDIEQSRQILLAGKYMELNINFHGDELHPTQSAEVSNCKL